MPETSLVAAEARADVLVKRLRRGVTDPEALLACLRASPRPYFTWAAAWMVLDGLAEAQPEDEGIRAGVEALRALEPAASELDGRALTRRGATG